MTVNLSREAFPQIERRSYTQISPRTDLKRVVYAVWALHDDFARKCRCFLRQHDKIVGGGHAKCAKHAAKIRKEEVF